MHTPYMWGPQYRVETEIEHDDVDNRDYVVCEHSLVDAEEGYVCEHCGKYFPAMVDDVVVYNCGDDTLDHYYTEVPNPELIES